MASPLYAGIIHCGKTIIQEEGTRSLWKGLTPFSAHLFLKYALRMGTNAVYQNALRDEVGCMGPLHMTSDILDWMVKSSILGCAALVYCAELLHVAAMYACARWCMKGLPVGHARLPATDRDVSAVRSLDRNSPAGGWLLRRHH